MNVIAYMPHYMLKYVIQEKAFRKQNGVLKIIIHLLQMPTSFIGYNILWSKFFELMDGENDKCIWISNGMRQLLFFTYLYLFNLFFHIYIYTQLNKLDNEMNNFISI